MFLSNILTQSNYQLFLIGHWTLTNGSFRGIAFREIIGRAEIVARLHSFPSFMFTSTNFRPTSVKLDEGSLGKNSSVKYFLSLEEQFRK